MEGTIVRIVADKRFGFIRCADNGIEYFFHQTAYQGDWDKLITDYSKRPVIVRFQETTGTKGPRAENVIKA